MTNKQKKVSVTPLHALSTAVCKPGAPRLFHNQVVMYQLLIPFVCDQLNTFSTDYAPLTVDELITDIRRYLVFMYRNPGGRISQNDATVFSCMHRYIYDNLANRDSGCEMPPLRCNNQLLSVTELRGEGNLESNINSTIKNRRALPKKWERLLRDNASNYIHILYRCFWVLQYYFVYYGHQIEPVICTINSNADPEAQTTTQFIEYFPFEIQKSRHVYSALSTSCAAYSDYFNEGMPETIDLLSLSRIILDIIIEQINIRQRLPLNKIADASEFKGQDRPVLTEQVQYEEYTKILGGFGSHSYDRYNMLVRFAPTNCYAADELGDIYYWGRSFVVRQNDYFEIESDYEKAAVWYQKAIENSNPPLQSACWSLSYTLTNIRYASEKEREAAEKKAVEYLRLAGEYPPAYNRIAYYIFRDAQLLYDEKGEDDDSYEDILLQFSTAIRLADRAGKMHWFYGNNQIASFLMKNEKNKRLLSDLRKRLKLHVPLDIEAQLSYAASYHNPWAQRRLALRYLAAKRKPEAKELLSRAMESNYNAAYYETAKYFHKKRSAKWMELMEKASGLSYPLATYELAAAETNPALRQRLILLSRQQAFSEKALDRDLLHMIDALSASDIS